MIRPNRREDAVDRLVCFLLNTTRDFSVAFEAFGWSTKDEFLRNGVHSKIKRCRTCKTWRPIQNIQRWPCPHCNHEPLFTLADSMFLKSCGIASNRREAKCYFVSGKVQGVGFRNFTRCAAERLGMAGYVKNLRDGGVEVYAQGTTKQHAVLRSELERGPSTATVSAVIEEDAVTDSAFERDFSIEYEGPMQYSLGSLDEAEN